MRTVFNMPLRIAFVMVVAALAACRPRPPEPSPAPPPPPPEVAARADAPDATEITESVSSRPANAKPPGAKPAGSEPAVAAMKLASVSSKLGVPVDLRYQFADEIEDGRPVTLHLAAVPRVAGSNLVVSIKQEAGIEARTGDLSVQKASATAAYRQQLSVTRHAGAPAELRVLVTMDLPEGSAFGYYSVPFAAAAGALKREGTEQR